MKANLIYTANLTPHNGRKSFGGLARVLTYAVGNNTVEVLVSYDTSVAAVLKTDTENKMFRLYNVDFFSGNIEGWRHNPFFGYSTTTGNHLAAFHVRNNMEWNGKAGWCKMKPVTLDEVLSIAGAA